jgi:hypothetical protein
MKKITLNQMEKIEGAGWLAAACGAGLVGIQASFAVPVLFAFVAPLTVSACLASGLQAAIDAGY